MKMDMVKCTIGVICTKDGDLIRWDLEGGLYDD